MIQDLTADGDFNGRSNHALSHWGAIISLLTEDNDNLSAPYDEVVLTGSGYDRDNKRYILECETDEKNMCDCCGDPIRIKPWDFDDTRTLCPRCMAYLEENYGQRENELVREVVDDNFRVKIRKPWDMPPDVEHPIDNVLLWD